MESLDSLISNLLEITNKTNLMVDDFHYAHNVFNLTVNEDVFNKIHNGDIVLYNHSTNQYRIFKFIAKNNNSIDFKFENLYIHINKNIDS